MTQLAETEILAIALAEAKLPDQCGHKSLIAVKQIQNIITIKKACRKGNFLSYVLQEDC